MSAPRAVERDVAILACAISAGIHGALTPLHWGENARMGASFLASGLVLAGVAIVLTRRAHPGALVLAALTLTGLLGGYVLAVTTGLPVLQPEPEPVDGLALATKLVEVAGIAATLDLLRRSRLLPVLDQPEGTTA